jgi:hypothetical protein
VGTEAAPSPYQGEGEAEWRPDKKKLISPKKEDKKLCGNFSFRYIKFYFKRSIFDA